jgi:hypothetical protein
MIELHTIAPKLTAANLWKTAGTTYDATHGFSDQYIVEIPAEAECIQILIFSGDVLILLLQR